MWAGHSLSVMHSEGSGRAVPAFLLWDGRCNPGAAVGCPARPKVRPRIWQPPRGPSRPHPRECRPVRPGCNAAFAAACTRMCDRLDLPEVWILGGRLPNRGILLSTIRSGRIVQPKVAFKLEAAAAAPSVLRQLLGQFFGRFDRDDAPAAIFVHHGSPPLSSCAAMKVGQ